MINRTGVVIRSDGEEVVVDNKFMRERYPLLVSQLHSFIFACTHGSLLHPS